MSTYFGNQTQTAGTATNAARWNRPSVTVFTCPGSGNQTIKELSAYVYAGGGTCHIRVAIYSEDMSTLIAQGIAEITVTGGAYSWQGHLTQADITPNPATLVGGTKYVIVVSNDGDGGITNYPWIGLSGTSTSGDYYNADYTGGFPASLTVGGYGYCPCVRCGVDPAVQNYTQNLSAATVAPGAAMTRSIAHQMAAATHTMDATLPRSIDTGMIAHLAAQSATLGKVLPPKELAAVIVAPSASLATGIGHTLELAASTVAAMAEFGCKCTKNFLAATVACTSVFVRATNKVMTAATSAASATLAATRTRNFAAITVALGATLGHALTKNFSVATAAVSAQLASWRNIANKWFGREVGAR